MVFSRKLELLALAGLLAGFAEVSLGAAVGSGRFYCCADPVTGKHLCGDILPQPCYGRAYRELGADGRTIREVGPPLTSEQIAERAAKKAAEDEARRQEAITQREQQRKDQMMLDTYTSPEEIDALRDRAIEEARQAIHNAETRIAEVRVQRKKFENEAEFYKSKSMPPEVQKGLADTEFEIKAQETIIEARKKEITAAQAKFDEDRKYFIELKKRKESKKAGRK